ncbi:hypothetical protein ISN45_Aa01g039630 [Arabidopsis thaliana x Arabidopsis arenosa]|uniref:Uncharacterized protein n=1 Tax=Arabidopsis thaliana x Arabidopsis arenosa TaxID=1240361 RepID=A0A8T2C6U7_9BRAS|nr:hypothetical protein ISN45_Aa01g039630 [Arabidopsis thaliana x Arabidopsis arenosa]
MTDKKINSSQVFIGFTSKWLTVRRGMLLSKASIRFEVTYDTCEDAKLQVLHYNFSLVCESTNGSWDAYSLRVGPLVYVIEYVNFLLCKLFVGVDNLDDGSLYIVCESLETNIC